MFQKLVKVALSLHNAHTGTTAGSNRLVGKLYVAAIVLWTNVCEHYEIRNGFSLCSTVASAGVRVDPCRLC